MEYIRDKDGNIIQSSRNLAGIRRYVGGYLPPTIKMMSMDEIANKEGKLLILFESGNSFETTFASYEVLKDFVKNWRNVQGAPLWVNGTYQGLLNRNLSCLKEKD